MNELTQRSRLRYYRMIAMAISLSVLTCGYAILLDRVRILPPWLILLAIAAALPGFVLSSAVSALPLFVAWTYCYRLGSPLRLARFERRCCDCDETGGTFTTVWPQAEYAVAVVLGSAAELEDFNAVLTIRQQGEMVAEIAVESIGQRPRSELFDYGLNSADLAMIYRGDKHPQIRPCELYEVSLNSSGRLPADASIWLCWKDRGFC